MTNTSESAQTLPTPADEQDWQPTISADDERVSDAVRGYVTALLWSSAYTFGDGEMTSADNAHNDYDLSDFSADDQTAIVADVYAMIAGHAESERDFLAYLESGRDAEHFGHDFALTRNGHGAGFWDRGLGELGDRLTAMAQPYGESSVDVSDDGVMLA